MHLNKDILPGADALSTPQTVILDEPTLGLDPDARRLVWDYIRERCIARTIIVTTQSAEEAEALGKRIAVINKGKVLCCGTPDFLNEKYGVFLKLDTFLSLIITLYSFIFCLTDVGYRLTIEKNNEKPFDAIRSFIEVYFPDMECLEDSENHVTLLFHIYEGHKIEAMLSDLEQQKLDLSVINYEINAVTLEDVLVK